MTDSAEQSENENLRVLSLDGGGVRGYLSARILRSIELLLNEHFREDVPLGRRFDLIVGTSTGGIIALALAMGKPAKEVVSFYEKHLKNIFGSRHKAKYGSWIFRPFYKPAPLHAALDEFFEGATLHDVTTDVCITAVSLQNAMPRFYKSAYLARNSARLSEKLVDIALATSAAPLYFPAHSMQHSASLIDGGVCANNPAMVALVEAMQFETSNKRRDSSSVRSSRQLTEVAMLSIGTGQQCAMPYDFEKLSQGGVSAWSVRFDRNHRSFPFVAPDVPIIEVLMQSQSQLVHFQTQFLLKEKYLRINPELKFSMSLDDVQKVDDLKNLSDITATDVSFLTKNLSLS